jgi:hypothetical protein
MLYIEVNIEPDSYEIREQYSIFMAYEEIPKDIGLSSLIITYTSKPRNYNDLRISKI